MFRRTRHQKLTPFQACISAPALICLVMASGCSCQDTKQQNANATSASSETSSQPNQSEETQRSTVSSSNGSSGEESSASTPSSSEQAAKAAETLATKAGAQAEQGNYGKAFQLITQAIDLVRAFPEDTELRDMEKRLLVQAKTYGENANQAGDISPGKPLIIDRLP